MDQLVAKVGRRTTRARHPDVLILFEKAVRELDVASALQSILEIRHGLSAQIVQQNHPPTDVLTRLDPRVVALPFCYQERSNNAYIVRWPDAVFANLTWEQLFYPGNIAAKTPRGEFATRHVMHHAWSVAYADLLKRQGIDERSIFLNGHPALGLYRAPYRAYFPDRAALAAHHGLSQSRRWVFVPENYNWAFYEPSMIEQMIQDGQPRGQVNEMRRIVTESFEHAMRWLARLAREERVEVIVRPRPATPTRVFRARLSSLLDDIPPNLRVIATGTVREWILGSDVVVSSYSTSAIEAAVAQQPTYLVAPVPWPVSLTQPWHALVPALTSEAEFRDRVLSAAGQTAAALEMWASNTLAQPPDPILSLADWLAGLATGRIRVPEPAPWQAVTLPSRYPVPPRLVHLYRRHLRPWLRRPPRPTTETQPDVAAVAEIPGRLARWRELLGPYLASSAVGQKVPAEWS